MPDTQKDGTAGWQSPPSRSWEELVYARLGKLVKPEARDYPYPYQISFAGEYVLRVPVRLTLDWCAGCQRTRACVAVWASCSLGKLCWLCLKCDNACREATVAAGR